jgi:hypothetical protein
MQFIKWTAIRQKVCASLRLEETEEIFTTTSLWDGFSSKKQHKLEGKIQNWSGINSKIFSILGTLEKKIILLIFLKILIFIQI